MRAAVASLVTGLLLFAPVLAEPDAAPSSTRRLGVQLAPVASGSASTYWVREWRRRYRVEHRANVAHAGMVRRLRRTLAVRARAVDVIPGVWLALASCESGQRWGYNGSSGFDGGLQFHPSTWSAYRRAGEPAFAYEASALQQVEVARRVLAAQGWGAWPKCAAKLGLR